MKGLALTLCSVLIVVTAALAQEAKDPVTGNWGSDGLTYLELKFDGKSAVTGTTIWRDGTGFEHRAPIKTGTFDPKSGVLKLEGEGKKPDGTPAQYVIEGKIAGDTVSGSFKMGSDTGQFTFKRQAPAGTSPAQSIGSGSGLVGTWVGHMARDQQRISITVVLKSDGKAITGTITGPPSPGDITQASLDPATGALTLDIAVQDANKTPARFEGTLAGTTATGRVIINGQEAGTFSLTKQE